MRGFLRFLVCLLLLLVLGALGGGGYLFLHEREEHAARQRELEGTNIVLIAETTRLRAERDLVLAESFRLSESLADLTRRYEASTAECSRVRADVRLQVAERERVEKVLRAEIGHVRARAKKAEGERDRARARVSDDGDETGAPTLKELVELTDEAAKKNGGNDGVAK